MSRSLDLCIITALCVYRIHGHCYDILHVHVHIHVGVYMYVIRVINCWSHDAHGHNSYLTMHLVHPFYH